VVEAAFVRVQQHAGVLAAVAVALADVLRAELRALPAAIPEPASGGSSRSH
jgi:hypothetical protein